MNPATNPPRAGVIILATASALGGLFALTMLAAMTGALVMANEHEACIEGAGDCDE